MILTEKNKIIMEMFQQRIDSLRLRGKLAMDPIENGFKRRNHFTKDNQGTGIFTVFLWQLNKLADYKLTIEIDNRIEEARMHFNLIKED